MTGRQEDGYVYFTNITVGRKSQIYHNDRPTKFENVYVWTASYPSPLLPPANARLRNLKIDDEEIKMEP